MILSKFIDTYEAPFASVINDKGTWIPFEYALLMLNSGLLIVNNCILIDIPQKTIIDCFNDVLVNDSEFTFDWNKDIGYTDVDETVSVMSNHFVNVFSGLLDFDGYSWAELFQALVFDSSSYDSKYGKNLALFLCTEADEELNATIEQMDFVDEMLDGNLGRALNIQSKSINGSVENLYNQCNNLLTEIKSGNSSSLSMYNRTYKEFEKALNKQTWFSKTGDKILQIQDGLSSAAKALRAISLMGEVVSYGAEFSNQDEFSLSALKTFLATSSTDFDLPKAMKQSMNDYSELLSTDLITYSAKRTFEENIDTLITGDGAIAEALGAQACMALFVWNMASNMIPFISNGLDAADKVELAVYAQVFQADSKTNYIQKRDSILYNEEKIIPENLYTLSQYLYVYLKSCYVARNAAIASLNGKRESIKEKIQSTIDTQNKMNAKIARILNVLKNANKTNEDNVYGFLPSDNKKYLENNSDNNLVSFIESNSLSTSQNITAMDLTDKSKDLVVDAMRESATLRGINYEYAIPKIELSSNDASEVNQKILNDYGKEIEYELENIKKGFDSFVYKIDYSYSVNSSILSVKISEIENGNYSTYSTFNFDISSGKLLTSSELLSKYDYTEADIILCIQKDINNRYDEYGSKYEEQRRIALKQNEKLADKHFEDSFVLVDNNVFYIDENNNMHNIYYAKSVAGAEGYYYDITLSK